MGMRFRALPEPLVCFAIEKRQPCHEISSAGDIIEGSTSAALEIVSKKPLEYLLSVRVKDGMLNRSGLMYHPLFQGVAFTKSVGPPGSGGLTGRHALPIDRAIDVDSVEEGESPVEAGAARV